jgi:hypothetical protein
MRIALGISLLVAGSAAAQDIKVEGTLGTVDVAAVQLALEKSAAAVEGCYRQHAGSKRYVGGAVTLRVRVAKDGAVKSTAVDSDLGAWEVEKCLIGVARGLRFGKPRGGEAEVTLPLEFPPRAEAAAGDGDELAAQLGVLARCGKTGEVTVTAYVGPGGKITTAGFSSQKPLPEGWGDCALGKARALRFSDPRGRVVKLAARTP